MSSSSTVQQKVHQLLTLLLLLCAATPPLLVLLDRWFDNQQISNSLSRWWCVTAFLCKSAWRPYFLIVFMCTLALVILVFVVGTERIDEPSRMSVASERPMVTGTQRRVGLILIGLGLIGVLVISVPLISQGGIVGWPYFFVCILYLAGCLLYLTPLIPVWQYLRSKWTLIFAYILGWAVVCSFLFSFFGRHEISIFLIALMIVAALILYQLRQAIRPSYWLLLLSLIVFTLRLNAWYYSYIGDEYAFYGAANYLAQQTNSVEIGNNLFNGTVVYAEHPYIVSLLPAGSIKLFDNLNFGWRFGSILASAFSVLFFYSFFRTFFARWVAFSATFFIAVSHYLMSFSRIGYDNTQALLAMSMALAAAGWAIRSGRRIAFLATGSALAFCFYVFPAALYIPPVVLWLLVWYRPPWQRAAWLDWAMLVFTTLILILPLFSQPRYWESKMAGFISVGSDQRFLSVVQSILTQFAYAFYSFLYIINASHFVTVAYLDALTAGFVLIGFGVLLQRLFKDKFAMVILSSWAMLLLFVGATHQYSFPPNTRMFLLVPWFSMVAAIGLQWLSTRFKVLRQRPWLARGVLIGVFMTILGLNLYQAYVVSVQHRIRNSNFESLFVRIGQSLASRPDSLPQAMMFVYDPSKHDISMLRNILNIEYLSIHVREIDMTSLNLDDIENSLRTPDQVVVFSPFLDKSIRSIYEKFLSLDQRIKCQMALGNLTIDVWYPMGSVSPCTEPSSTGSVRLPSSFDLIGVALILIYVVRHRLGQTVKTIPVRLAQWREAWPLQVRFKYENLGTSDISTKRNPSEADSLFDTQRLKTSRVVIDLKVQVRVHPGDQAGANEARISSSQTSDDCRKTSEANKGNHSGTPT